MFAVKPQRYAIRWEETDGRIHTVYANSGRAIDVVESGLLCNRTTVMQSIKIQEFDEKAEEYKTVRQPYADSGT